MFLPRHSACRVCGGETVGRIAQQVFGAVPGESSLPRVAGCGQPPATANCGGRLTGGRMEETSPSEDGNRSIGFYKSGIGEFFGNSPRSRQSGLRLASGVLVLLNGQPHRGQPNGGPGVRSYPKRGPAFPVAGQPQGPTVRPAVPWSVGDGSRVRSLRLKWRGGGLGWLNRWLTRWGRKFQREFVARSVWFGVGVVGRTGATDIRPDRDRADRVCVALSPASVGR